MWSEGRRVQESCGLRDTSAGMAVDTCGFRDAGFARPGPVRFGFHLPGLSEKTDGYFAEDTGGDPPRNRHPEAYFVPELSMRKALVQQSLMVWAVEANLILR